MAGASSLFIVAIYPISPQEKRREEKRREEKR